VEIHAGDACIPVDDLNCLCRCLALELRWLAPLFKSTLGLEPEPFSEVCYGFWQGGDFVRNDVPQGKQVFCQINECIPEVVKAMRACIKETGVSKPFSCNITADDPNEMIARANYAISQFGTVVENCAFLVDGYVAGGTAVTACRLNFPQQFLHYHRAGHGSVRFYQIELEVDGLEVAQGGRFVWFNSRLQKVVEIGLSDAHFPLLMPADLHLYQKSRESRGITCKSSSSIQSRAGMRRKHISSVSAAGGRWVKKPMMLAAEYKRRLLLSRPFERAPTLRVLRAPLGFEGLRTPKQDGATALHKEGGGNSKAAPVLAVTFEEFEGASRLEDEMGRAQASNLGEQAGRLGPTRWSPCGRSFSPRPTRAETQPRRHRDAQQQHVEHCSDVVATQQQQHASSDVARTSAAEERM